MKKEELFSQKSLNFLEKYINNYSPTGNETEGQKLWLDYLKPYVDTHFTDIYGTAVAVINPESSYKVVIEAHADEISWRVSYINEQGFIYVSRNGGSDHQIAPSKRVVIHSKKGLIPAVFGWPAIHTRKEKEEKPELKNIFLDCGALSKSEVEEMGIRVGDIVSYPDEFAILNHRYFMGRALDNRMGGFMIAEVARQLHENKIKLPFGLYIVNSVQEEIGLRGAEMIVERIKPNVAIVTDVTHDTQTPMINKILHGDFHCGKGPVLSVGPTIQRNLLSLIEESAEKNKIAYQRMAENRSTGTDTDSFAYGAAGVASALISLPLRYMHTTVEMVDQTDVYQVIQLIYQSLQEIQDQHNFNYIQ